MIRRRADRDARSSNQARHLAVAGAVVLLGAFTHPSSAPRSDPGVYSYATDDHVVVMRGDDVVTRWSTQGAATGRMVWTDDGNHVAFLAEGDAARELVTLDARSGAERTLPCDTCARVAAAGNDVLMVGTQDGDGFSGLLRLDLGRATPPADVPADLPPLVDAAIFSGTNGEVLLQGVDRTGGEVHLRVRPDGTTSPVGTATHARRDRQGRTFLRELVDAAVAVDHEGNTVYAVVGGFQAPQGSCEHAAEVFVALPSRQSTVPTDLSGATPVPDVDAATSTTVLSAWWDHDDRLHAAVLASVCDGEASIGPTSGEWVLDHNRWTQVSTDLTLGSRSLRDGSEVVTRFTGDHWGGADLVLERGPEPTHIADGVLSLAAPMPRRTGSDQVLEHLCDPRDAVCLARVGRDYEAGSATGDFDGDGAPDRATVVRDQRGTTSVKLAFAGGRSETVALTATVDQGVPHWAGATDLTGDGRAELLVPLGTKANGVVLGLFRYADGRLTEVQGDLTGPVVGAGAQEASGIRCLEEDGRRLLRTRTARTGSTEYVLREVTYAADESGRLVRVTDESFTFPTGADGALPPQLADVPGVHCPGVPALF
ncbi:hypothetical protein [Saccharothrix sp. NRRL B-16314]|uniref:hypothetical protein n=1 Tax=Saccharothrix sp. NRRL B-16314 TaxID=1463825 RepID=UPI000525C3CC|nr:hypothetical protein [Saccharothrix sp. NRRL B-16314]